MRTMCVGVCLGCIVYESTPKVLMELEVMHVVLSFCMRLFTRTISCVYLIRMEYHTHRAARVHAACGCTHREVQFIHQLPWRQGACTVLSQAKTVCNARLLHVMTCCDTVRQKLAVLPCWQHCVTLAAAVAAAMHFHFMLMSLIYYMRSVGALRMHPACCKFVEPAVCEVCEVHSAFWQ